MEADEKDINASNTNDELNDSVEDSSVNEQAEESHVKCDDDNKSEGNMLEESSIKLIQF